jgi:DNA-binding NarL/FixJ family response regulator
VDTVPSTRCPRPGHPGPVAGAAPVPVDVLADDDLTAAGARAYLATRAEVRVVPRAEATVVLVLATVADRSTWQRLGPVPGPVAPRLVVVTDAMGEEQLAPAVGVGLSSVLPRRDVTWNRVVGALVAAASGHVDLPAVQVRWLLDQLRALQRGGPAPEHAGGLSAREVEVLRLLADGHGTGDIATMLSFSERTIKNVISTVMGRHNLRSRSHAVAHALRIGAL